MLSSPIVRGLRCFSCGRGWRGVIALSPRRLAALGLLAGLCLTGRAGVAASQTPGPAQVAPPVGAGAPAPAPSQAAEAGGSFSLSLPQAFEMAMAANRALAAARLARPIGQANVAVAGERPNPDLLLEKLRETPHEAATLSLPIETAGKRQRRIAAAEADAASGEAEIARTTAATRNQMRRAFYALLAAQRRVVEEQASLDIAQRAAGAARARFDAGAAPRLDALQTELVASQASNDAEGARGMLAAARSQLNTLLDRPPLAGGTAEGELAGGPVPGGG